MLPYNFYTTFIVMQSPDIFAIMSAFLMHSGARHVSFDLTDVQKKIISLPFTKFLILFAMFYISTRNLYWSFLLLLLYIMLIKVLINEKHALNILPKSWLHSEGFITEKINHVDLYLENLNSLNHS